MYRHFFWCAFGNISIAAVALLASGYDYASGPYICSLYIKKLASLF